MKRTKHITCPETFASEFQKISSLLIIVQFSLTNDSRDIVTTTTRHQRVENVFLVITCISIYVVTSNNSQVLYVTSSVGRNFALWASNRNKIMVYLFYKIKPIVKFKSMKLFKNLFILLTLSWWVITIKTSIELFICTTYNENFFSDFFYIFSKFKYPQ